MNPHLTTLYWVGAQHRLGHSASGRDIIAGLPLLHHNRSSLLSCIMVLLDVFLLLIIVDLYQHDITLQGLVLSGFVQPSTFAATRIVEMDISTTLLWM